MIISRYKYQRIFFRDLCLESCRRFRRLTALILTSEVRDTTTAPENVHYCPKNE